MSELSQLKGITDEEIRKLEAQQIKTIDQLWVRVGQDYDSGIDQIARISGVNRRRLIDLLASYAEEEAERVGTHGLKRFWRAAALVLSVLIFLVLLRSVGTLEFLPRPFGLPGKHLVTVRDLEAGRVLRSGDLSVARGTAGDGYFQSLGEVSGLILSKSVPQHKPLAFEEVLRLQVVTTKDILPNATITPDAVSLSWSSYQPGAAISLDQVVEHSARVAFRSGDVILTEFIDPVSPVVSNRVRTSGE